jgi:2'-5' RNA ligase
MDSEVKFRLFLGLPLAAAFQREVEPLIEKLRQSYPQIRWVKAGEIHATLHFFGSVGEGEIPKISEVVRRASEKAAPLRLSLGGIGAFPNAARPRVVWLGMSGEVERLRKLQSEIERGLRGAGYPCEDREFKAHLTLGRVKEEKRAVGLESVDFLGTAEREVAELVLFRSHLTPEGAHYERVETFPLSAS